MSGLGPLVLEICAKWLFNLAPPVITRWLLSPEKLAEKIKVELGSGHSIEFHHQNGIYRLETRIAIRNKSALKCTIDRVLFRFENLSELNEFQYFHPEVLESLEDKTIYVQKTLSEVDVAIIRKHFVAGNQLRNPRLNIWMVFITPIGLVLKHTDLYYQGDIPNPVVN